MSRWCNHRDLLGFIHIIDLIFFIMSGDNDYYVILDQSPVGDERKRLEALHNYNILDTHAEKEFDRLTELAAIICETPLAGISLVDNARQWFKSRYGHNIDHTKRKIAFCNYAIKSVGIFEIEDASKDARFKNFPFVIDKPNIRFYAAAPVKVGNNLNVGVICVIDDKPRKLDSVQVEALKALSRMVGVLLENRKQYSELKEAFTLGRRILGRVLVNTSL